MIYAEKFAAGQHATDSCESTASFGLSVSVDYWLLDESGDLADPTCVADLPGADRTDSPHSIAIETPVCESCSGLRDVLIDELRAAQTAASDQHCRLLAAGVRPDQLEGDRQDGPLETAGTRVRFETDRETATTVYNVLLALDPAFVLLASTSEDGALARSRRAALLDGSRSVVQGYRAAQPTPQGVETIRPAGESDDHWQPVAMVDETTVEWRSLESSTPTLLVDLIADVLAVLYEATDCRMEVGTFGNGFGVGCLSLPSAAWRQQYLDDAVTKGLTSLRLRAYLERLGFDTSWYRRAQPPVVVTAADSDRRARCRRRADLLAAEA